ncbi:MAG: SDR family NAD(P)-dependent oxidoreductase [Anaerolineales bacterium]
MTFPSPRKPLPRVLITGGAGFIGSHLAEELLARGYYVTIIDDLSTGRFENIAPLTAHPNFRFAIDTITNEVVMDRLVSECDLIIHLAAAVGVMLIVERPVHTIEANVMGTEAVLKAALRYRTKVLIASTSEVYGKGNKIPFREEDDVVLGPTSRSRWGYAASKMVDEFLALAYHHEKGLPVVIFRLFNTVGPRQSSRYGMVIPRFVDSALKGQPLPVTGDGQQSRCFMHVHDAVEAIIRLSEHPNAVGKVFNVGATAEITIYDLAVKVLTTVAARRGVSVNPEDQIELIPYDKAYAAGFEDMRRRVPDTTKIKELTGWEPMRSLERILSDVIAEKMAQA